MDLARLISKSMNSGLYLRLLNTLLNRNIPFNRPHGIKIVHIDHQSIKTFLPYKKRNFNHIRGLHACVLATLAEFTTGFMLISRLNSKQYRIIMKRLQMDYRFQGKMDAFSQFSISDEWLQKNIYEPLKSEEAVVSRCTVEIFDNAGNLLAVGDIDWQVKAWEKVKTKVA